jgi:hypothetical protein
VRIVRFSSVKSERDMREERCFFHGHPGEKAREVRKPRRAKGSDLDDKSGSVKEHSFFCGRKSLERRCKAVKVMQQSARAERENRNDFLDHRKGKKL